MQGGRVLGVTSDWKWCQQNTCSCEPRGSADFREESAVQGMDLCAPVSLILSGIRKQIELVP